MTIARNNLTKPGMPQSAALENEKRRLDTFRIIGGPGVRISQTGDIVRIDVDAPRGGGGGLSIQWVKELPAIPTAPQTSRIVFWAGADRLEGGTGDNQLWTASTGDTRWYPCGAKFTDKTGLLA